MTATGWLRTSYRVGAAVDALAAVQMVAGSITGCAMMRPGFTPGADYRYAMGMGACLMLGWTVLLLWADRSPLERRGVLPITVLVVVGLAGNELLAVRAGFLRLAPAAVLWSLQGALVLLFARSCVAARAERARARQYAERSTVATAPPPGVET